MDAGITEGGAGQRHRLVVRSIGSADATVIPALRRVRRAPDAELAAIIYRAPSELLAGLDAERGGRLCDLLRETGLEVDLEPEEAPFEAGRGEFEIALAVRRFDAMLALVEETMRLVAVDAETARRIVCAMPAVLLGAVSGATVDALRERFARHGADVDASRTADARFDIAVEAGDETTRSVLATLLEEHGSATAWTDRGLLLTTGYDAATAARFWEQASRTSAKMRILNRDLLRFDVRLEHLPADDEARSWLVHATGMPERLAATAIGRLPLTIAENVPGPSMAALLGEVHALGGRASGVLLALQRFALDVQAGGDREALRPWVEAIGSRADGQRFADGGTNRLDGPFTKTEARWLQLELRRGGVASTLLER